jgi:hypothetical protein
MPEILAIIGAVVVIGLLVVGLCAVIEFALKKSSL